MMCKNPQKDDDTETLESKVTYIVRQESNRHHKNLYFRFASDFETGFFPVKRNGTTNKSEVLIKLQ